MLHRPKPGTDIRIVVPTGRATGLVGLAAMIQRYLKRRVKRGRWAVNSKRYRRRYDAGQRVLSVTVVPYRAKNFLVRKGRLLPGKHSIAEIEATLARLINDEGRE